MIANGLARLLAPVLGAETPYQPWHDFWYADGSTRFGDDAAISDEAALRVDAFYACLRVLCETMGYLPWFTYERRADGGRDRAPNHPIYPLLHSAPNPYETALEWKETIVWHDVMRGKHWSRIIRDEVRPGIQSLIPINPDRVTEEKLPSGRRRLRVKNDPEDPADYQILLPDEVLYVPAKWGGMSIFDAARALLNEQTQALRYSTRSLAQGVKSSGVLQHPKNLSDAASKRLREQWNELYVGPGNAGRVIILEEDMEYKSVSMSNEDFQFIELRAGGVEAIARDFRMHPIMIGHSGGTPAWGTGIESIQLGFVVFTMLPWAGRFEQRANLQLLNGSTDFYTEIGVDALLRGDAKSRAEALKIMREDGVINGNEWRAKENMNPVDAGDVYWRPANYVPWDTPPAAASSSSPAPAAAGELPAADPRAKAFARALASQVVAKESKRMRAEAKRYADDGVAWAAAVRGFYDELAGEIEARCFVEAADAQAYAAGECERLLEGGAALVESWEPAKISALQALMLEAKT